MREFKIYWDKEKNIPVMVDEETDNVRIKSEGLEYIATDFRPVFLEEKHLIKNLFSLSEDVYMQSVWCTKQGKYIINGERVKKSAVQEAKAVEDIDNFREIILSFKPSPTQLEKEKEIFDTFIEANREYLYNLLESQERDEEGEVIGAYPFINEVAEKYKDRINMVSFSGGKDSTVVSHLVRKALNNQSILHIFGDTTLELPKTYEYVEKFKEANPMTPFFEEKNEENNFFEMCEEIGPPSRVKSWCCSIFKTGPMGATLTSFEEKFLTFYGVRRKESMARSKYKKVTLTPKIHGGMVASPVIDWLDIDIWLYMLTEDIQFNKSYREGFARVGCWVCPNNSYWSQLLAKLYVVKENFTEEEKKKIKYDSNYWEEFLYGFAEKIVKNHNKEVGKNMSPIDLKEEIKNYVEDGKWKARQGGAGLEKSEEIIAESKECVNEKNSYNLTLPRKIEEDFFELLKPFGKLNYSNKKKIQEVYVISRTEEPLFKVLYKDESPEIKITIMSTKDRYLYGKITKQLNKYNSCMSCQACNSACQFGAITVRGNRYKIDESKCTHCLNCVSKFDTGCLISSALKIKK